MHILGRTKIRLLFALCGVLLAIVGILYVIESRSARAQSDEAALVPSENGVWLWNGVGSLSTEERDQLFKAARTYEIDTIYLNVNSYSGILAVNDEVQRAKLIDRYDTMIEDFLVAAHTAGFAVDAVMGTPRSAQPDEIDRTLAVLSHVIEFNESHAGKFRGFQYDVEPYTLDRYADESIAVLTEFLDLMQNSVTHLEGRDLLFAVAIPDFFDGPGSPRFRFAGKAGYTFDHLLDILARRPGSTAIVMAYRDRASGPDGMIERASSEMERAENTSTRVIVAIEVGKVDSPHVSFYALPTTAYLSAIQEITDSFSSRASFGGIATHYLEALPDIRQD